MKITEEQYETILLRLQRLERRLKVLESEKEARHGEYSTN